MSQKRTKRENENIFVPLELTFFREFSLLLFIATLKEYEEGDKEAECYITVNNFSSLKRCQDERVILDDNLQELKPVNDFKKSCWV